MTPEMLIGMLAELERIRELTLDLVERNAPRLLPAPADEPIPQALHASELRLLRFLVAGCGEPRRHLLLFEIEGRLTGSLGGIQHQLDAKAELAADRLEHPRAVLALRRSRVHDRNEPG